MSFETKESRVSNLGLITDSKFSVENYRKNLRKIKHQEEIQKNRLLNVDNLPKLPDYNEGYLKSLGHKLMEELDYLDIRFIGVSIEVDFNKPLFIVHLPKEYRGGFFAAYDLPEEFMKFKVQPITAGKFKF